jgi:radical SAM enzyme (TIGR01210 family)
VDPWKAHGSVVEDERRKGGTVERALTVFLAGAECPFTCSFCDLWRWTIDTPTPEGALPKQIADVLDTITAAPQRLKLYNASNFFDPRAVPATDLPRIAALASGFGGVTVESHANTIGPAVLDFAQGLSGRLEVAVGLETIHPEAKAHANKRMTLSHFDAAARFLTTHDVDLRVFVLLGLPYIPPEASVEWAIRTVEYATSRGAAVVSVIPVRGGNGEMERLEAAGHFTPPTLAQHEATLDGCLGIDRTVITADLWDIHRLTACPACRSTRIDRLRRINLSGTAEPPVSCGVCGA